MLSRRNGTSSAPKNSEEPTFQLQREHQDVCNSTELRLCGFQMSAVPQLTTQQPQRRDDASTHARRAQEQELVVGATVRAEFDGHPGGWFGNVTEIRHGDVDVFFRTDSDLVKYSFSEVRSQASSRSRGQVASGFGHRGRNPR